MELWTFIYYLCTAHGAFAPYLPSYPLQYAHCTMAIFSATSILHGYINLSTSLKLADCGNLSFHVDWQLAIHWTLQKHVTVWWSVILSLVSIHCRRKPSLNPHPTFLMLPPQTEFIHVCKFLMFSHPTIFSSSPQPRFVSTLSNLVIEPHRLSISLHF